MKRRSLQNLANVHGALTAHGEPDEVITDLAQALETAIEQLVPNVFHNTWQHKNNRVACDHGRLKARLRPMRGLNYYGLIPAPHD